MFCHNQPTTNIEESCQNILNFRAVGKSRAMEICLTGNQFTAKEAEAMGLISKAVPHDQLMPEVLKVAEKIASLSKITVAMCKEAVNNCKD